MLIVLALSYLAASICFIVGIKWMNHPATARTGNRLSALGMTLAVVITMLNLAVAQQDLVKDASVLWSPQTRWALVLGGLVLGTVIGGVMAKTVKMTDMPQAVAIFNGLGGGAAAAVSVAGKVAPTPGAHGEEMLWSIVLGTIIGSITFAGSLIAFGKLQGLISGKPVTFPGMRLFNNLLILVTLGLGVWVMVLGHDPIGDKVFILTLVLANLFGIMLVLPIGGADMPVVISLLNSFTGTAAAITGFVLQNNVLIIAGALVGASGFILTMLMCKAMNRNLWNVMFVDFGGGGGSAGTIEGSQQETSAEDVAVMLAYASRVIIVPGYGLAVAQAQHAVQEMAVLLEKRGVSVKYAIHPVAGRMPGHMNVLLAEANVPYSLLYDMEDINSEFEQADVALVIGANDVTNPAARTDTSSPIYGMPILDVDKAKNIVVVKRGKGTGYAGIENLLYYNPKCKMLFADAKAAVSSLIAEVQHV
ncbi:MAG: NAD(P)(+) transhydrogenase (Re/Si-specific) subunit beta [Armatimonadetes bacterium]|nr:NAD(P)(+) transhydrogenase (Re/Si-specific) subunit beta [Armatimonadota bacterium]